MAIRNRFPRIGEVYFMHFGGEGNEQNGWRPGLVFQNNVGNRYSPNIIALPLTSALKKREMPTHVVLPAAETGLPRDSMVLCENPERMSKEKIGRFITTLPEDYMAQVARANLLASSAVSFLELENVVSIWQQAQSLNEFPGSILSTKTE